MPGSGIGAYACQYVLNGGGTPIAVVSSPERAAVVREMGVEHVIDRKEENSSSGRTSTTQDPAEWRRLGKLIRELAGTDPEIVFEHPGRFTMGASVFVCARGGMIITCAATTGFKIEYDNRYLWMNQKTLKGCHYANYREAWEANKLVCEGKIHPVLSAVFAFEDTGEAVAQVHDERARGKARRARVGAGGRARRDRSRDARATPRPDHAVPPSRLSPMPGEVPRRAAGVTYEIIEGQAVVIDPEGRELITLNDVGTMIWENLDGNRGVTELVDELLGNFDGVSHEEFEADVVAYLAELREAGIVERAAGA